MGDSIAFHALLMVQVFMLTAATARPGAGGVLPTVGSLLAMGGYLLIAGRF